MTQGQTVTLFGRLKDSSRLPSPPGTALRVLELCRNEATDVKEIASAVMADPALSGRLLRYANSAVVGAAREVASVRDAVLLLGLRTVKLTALGFSLTSGLEASCPGFSLKRFWTESVVTATLARRFAAQFSAEREEAFTAGLLAAIGRLALAHGLPEEYGPVQAAVDDSGVTLLDAERKQLGTDHVEFGAELLRHWGVPQRLVDAVAFRPHPDQAPPEAQGLARAVHVGAALAPTFLADDQMPSQLRRAARDTIEGLLDLDEESWQRIAEETMADYQQLAEVLEIELDPTRVFDLYGEAQEQATQVGIVAQLESTRALEENKDLLKRATTDALTGIANRARFDERIAELIAGVSRGHGHFALLLFDIDHFKKFNDTYGHTTGDLVLKNVAQTALRTLRDVDLLARYGGEEFTILAPHTDRRGACTITARTRKCVEDMRVEVDGQTLRVTISLGMALTSDYPQAPTVQQLIEDADKQLYLSKDTGRNTWSYQNRSAAQVAQTAAAR